MIFGRQISNSKPSAVKFPEQTVSLYEVFAVKEIYYFFLPKTCPAENQRDKLCSQILPSPPRSSQISKDVSIQKMSNQSLPKKNLCGQIRSKNIRRVILHQNFEEKVLPNNSEETVFAKKNEEKSLPKESVTRHCLPKDWKEESPVERGIAPKKLKTCLPNSL